jgi:hypothetical protein
MKCYTNYNELMRKALFLAWERGVKEQAELDKVIKEVFAADAENRK